MADDYTVGELAREVQRSMERMASLAARLEGGQFVNSELFRLYKEGVEQRFVSLQAEIALKADKTEVTSLRTEVASLSEDRKWLVRAVVFFVLMAILAATFAATGGVHS